VKLSKYYAEKARKEVDIDEPSVESLQTLLLLAMTFIAQGRGKKAYMMTGKIALSILLTLCAGLF
jgi:hypothetical protein